MNDAKSYSGAFELGKPLNGGAIGVVVKSNHESLKVGVSVCGAFPWTKF